MSQTDWSDAPLFQVRNQHSADCGIPPHIDDRSLSRYMGYFENQYGEQALFVYNRGSKQAILYLGDAGWDSPHTVVDGAVPDLVLSEIEQLWVRACWQAATANRKEA